MEIKEQKELTEEEKENLMNENYEYRNLKNLYSKYLKQWETDKTREIASIGYFSKGKDAGYALLVSMIKHKIDNYFILQSGVIDYKRRYLDFQTTDDLQRDIVTIIDFCYGKYKKDLFFADFSIPFVCANFMISVLMDDVDKLIRKKKKKKEIKI